MKFLNHLVNFQWFGEEPTIIRLVRVGYGDLAGHQDDPNVRPAGVRRMGKFQAVHAPRHLNIGEQQRDVVARFKYFDGFVGTDSLNR
ncbi:MAG: hypothetical protein ABIS23_05530 [Sphingomicrobium sp.]